MKDYLEKANYEEHAQKHFILEELVDDVVKDFVWRADRDVVHVKRTFGSEEFDRPQDVVNFVSALIVNFITNYMSG